MPPASARGARARDLGRPGARDAARARGRGAARPLRRGVLGRARRRGLLRPRARSGKRPVDALTSNAGHVHVDGDRPAGAPGADARLLLSDACSRAGGSGPSPRASAGYNPIGYHTGTVWPHDTSSSPTGSPGRVPAGGGRTWRGPCPGRREHFGLAPARGHRGLRPGPATAFPVSTRWRARRRPGRPGRRSCACAPCSAGARPGGEDAPDRPHLPGGRRTRLTWDGVRRSASGSASWWTGTAARSSSAEESRSGRPRPHPVDQHPLVGLRELAVRVDRLVARAGEHDDLDLVPRARRQASMLGWTGVQLSSSP